MKGYTIQHSIELLEKQAGSGSGALSAADVSFDNTETGLSSTNVQNAIVEVSKTNIYSYTETSIGRWLDDDLYRKVIFISDGVNISMVNWTDVNEHVPNIGFSKFIRAWGMDINGTYQGELLCGLNTSDHVQMLSPRNGTADVSVNYIIIEYTKTTVQSNTRSKKKK